MTQEKWYIVRGGQRYGPYPLEQLREFAGSGHLLPVDLVQREGKEQAVVASQIPGLFPVQSVPAPPPPPPPRQADRGQSQAVTSSPHSTTPVPGGQGLADLWAKLWQNKLWFFSALLLLSCIGNTCLASVFMPSGSSRTRGEPGGAGMMLVSFFALISLGLLITVIVLGVRQWSAKVDREVRRDKLHGLWEPVDGQGLTFQFTDDGGMIRSDGLATKYRWVNDDQEVELYEDGVQETIRFKIITISRDELVLKTGDQAGHFRKGTTISEEEMQRRWEETKATLKQVGKGAAVVAGGAAATVLALGGLAVLCGVAAVASAAEGSQQRGGGGLTGSSRETPQRGPEPVSDRQPQKLPDQPKKHRQAVAVTGAVIVRQEGNLCYYKCVCPRCGDVDSSTKGVEIPGRGDYLNGGHTCFRCKEYYPVRIQGAG